MDSSARKDVLITGAGGVIGSAVARRLGASFNLHLVTRRPRALSALARQLRSTGAQIQVIGADLRSPAQAASAVRRFFRGARFPFGLVCTAGSLSAPGRLMDLPFAQWMRGLQVNFLSHAAMIRSFAEHFRRRRLGGPACRAGRGAIVVFSGAGLGGPACFEGVSSYSTAKAALIHLAEALAPELEPLGITINAVAPGPVRSGMTEQALRAAKAAPAYAADARRIEAGHAVSPELAANLIEVLLGPRGAGLSGRLLSARFDTETVLREARRIRSDKDWFRMRRVDYARYGPLRS